ncbi:MAG TPA: ATP-binding protein [Gaiellaceae bacterium]|nr:ATP-binding protein [Gaiellaceae bacterium]
MDARARPFWPWAAAGALGLGAEWLGGGGLGTAAADLAAGLALLAGGLALWSRERRLALLFLATGGAWFLGTATQATDALLYVHRGPFVQLLLAYPGGRLRSRLDRAVVAAAYLDGLVARLAQDETLTLALGALVVATAAAGLRNEGTRAPRALATGAAAAYAAAIALPAAGGSLTETTLLLALDAALLVSALALAARVLAQRERPAVVADLVVELGSEPRSGSVRDALALAFGDPGLELGYRLGDGYVDGTGRPLALPGPGDGRAVTRVERGGEPVAAVVHDAALTADAALTEAVASAAALTAANARLQAELRRQLRELTVSRRRVVEAGDAQRSRLERRLTRACDVHLEEMRAAVARAAATVPTEAAGAIAVVEAELAEAVAELHRLARGIHPHTLTESGLSAALGELAATAPVEVSLEAPAERFAPAVEATAYFVCAEALVNVAKHAGARAVSVGVRRRNGRLLISIRDDGAGGAEPGRGSGLRGLADRVDAVGGQLTVSSPATRGTAVLAELPLEVAQ